MGYFIDIHNSANRAQGVAFINEQNGVQGSDSWKGELAVGAVNSVFQFIFSNIGVWAGDSDGRATSSSQSSETTTSVDTTDDAQKAQLEQEKAQLFSQLPDGAPQDSSQFNNYLNEKNRKMESSKQELEALQAQNTRLAQENLTLSTEIGELGDKITALTQDLQMNASGNTPEYVDNINEQIEQLKLQKEAKESRLRINKETIENNNNTVIPAYDKDFTQASDEYKNAQPIMEKIVNVEKQIQNIENGGVQEKARKLKSFTEALQAWKNAPDGSDKKALAQDVVDAFGDMKNKVSPSTIKLYQLYDQDLNNDINGTKADIYKEKEAKEKK